MHDNTISQHDTWPENRVILNTAFITDQGIVIDDAPADGCFLPDDDPVIN
jgi:hypothetical protein